MKNKKHPQPHQILLKAFENKKVNNPSYSRNALARDLGVSSVFVTKILTGEKNVPSARIKRLFQVLDMDINLQAQFIKATIIESLLSDELRELARLTFINESKLENYKVESTKKFRPLTKWYHPALLTYLTCSNLDSSPKAIARYFGVTEREILYSLENMEEIGLVENRDGIWRKVDAHSYFPTTRTRADVRDFHKQMIQMAYRELSKSDSDTFERRLISGFSIAANPKNLEKSKKLVFDFLSEISYSLSEGECSEIYQCNVQLFPFGGQKS